MNKQTLLLNADYTPLKAISWQRAVCLWYSDKVDIVEEYDETIRSVSLAMQCPAVVRLNKYVSGVQRKARYSKMAVLSRDHFKCLYCGVQPGTDQLNIDHVVPRSRGGTSTWWNTVASCVPCNSRKGDRTPHEAKMVLAYEPFKPDDKDLSNLRFEGINTPEHWKEYINN
jgi:5-methylcytosine-specific restriction endonuclease McrA